MPHPSPAAVQQSLKLFAGGPWRHHPSALSDGHARPLWWQAIALHIVRCAEKEPIRERLAQVLNRSFSLGATSFALDANEAEVILQ